jgi:alkylation response protein AidB-like acyl-CoA dehydrogenase
MHFELNEEQNLIRKMVRDFSENEVKPIAQEADREHRFPMETFRKMAKLGFFGLPFPEEYGGMGGDSISYAIAMEEISRDFSGRFAHLPLWQRGAEAEVPGAAGYRREDRLLWADRAGSGQ